MEKENIGYYLRRTREVREISLEEISNKTKISKRFLEAIEEGRWEILPGEVFIIGFIRAYSKVLGLNPDEIVEKYKQERGIFTEKIEEKKEKRYFFSYFYLIFALIAIIFLAFFWFFFFGKGKEVKKKEALIEKYEIPEKKEVNFAKKEDIKEEKIEILFSRLCWVRVEVDGIKVFEGHKNAQDKLEYSFKENFSLKVGDAGAIQIIKNGKVLPRLGEDGQPVLYKLP